MEYAAYATELAERLKRIKYLSFCVDKIRSWIREEVKYLNGIFVHCEEPRGTVMMKPTQQDNSAINTA